MFCEPNSPKETDIPSTIMLKMKKKSNQGWAQSWCAFIVAEGHQDHQNTINPSYIQQLMTQPTTVNQCSLCTC